MIGGGGLCDLRWWVVVGLAILGCGCWGVCGW